MSTHVALPGPQPTTAAVPAAPDRVSAREPEVDYTQEVRFAVVLYGGVSLANYMNGIAQELLHLVRATAPGREPAEGGPRRAHVPAAELRGTERVYRKLGQILRFGAEPAGGEPAPDAPIRTRFVVDIVSGTSAGGINGVFLAKALANDQSMRDLAALWIQEGDIARLLNDERSVRDLRGLASQDPPRSLLNSRRMYRKLLEALEAMEAPQRSRPECGSPYVDELDLFITATDIRGLELPLRLADAVVQEKRYRSVFRFRYDARAQEPRNDFHAANNPILAFAARCTSAFPAAFEPMRLADIDEVLAGFPAFAGDPGARAGSERWRAFFADYLRRPDGRGAPASSYIARAFGDGGYLDNKPFGHAIDALALRRAGLHVDRKLLFIEPAPHDLEREPLPDEPPDALENVLAALVSLPRAETIREDLQRVLARNRLIGRVDRILRSVEEDVRRRAGGERQDWDPAYADRGLTAMIRARGVAYGGYHRLKVEAVTDAIASLVTRAAGFDEDSDQFLAIRSLVGVWRDRRYAEDPPEPAEGQPRARFSQNRFLLEYDIDYRLRRLDALVSRADELRALDGGLSGRLEMLGIRTSAQPADIEAELARARRELVAVRQRLHDARATLWAAGAANPLHGDVLAAGIREEHLADLLAQPDEARQRQVAEALMDGPVGPRIAAIAQRLAGMIAEHTRAAARECERILKPDPAAPRSPVAEAARAALWHYYRFYEDYDVLAYPIFYATQVGDERDPVEVVRLSPLDATSLIDEARGPRRKLAGTRFGNFGAFLDRVWRENDMLWGRLDGAERLIAALLPRPEHEALRRRLTEEAHLAILAEEYGRMDQAELTRLMAEALARVEPANANEAALRRLVAADGSPVQPRLQAALRSSLEPQRLLEFFRRHYQVHRELDARPVLEALARATTVIGKMLSGLADRRGRDGRRFAWLARLGGAFWRLVEVAVPRSLPALVFGYWLQLLYIAEAVVIVVGTVASEPAQRAGLVALAATAAAHAAVTLVRGLVRGRRGPLRALAVLFVLALLGLAAYGAYALYAWGLPFDVG